MKSNQDNITILDTSQSKKINYSVNILQEFESNGASTYDNQNNMDSIASTQTINNSNGNSSSNANGSINLEQIGKLMGGNDSNNNMNNMLKMLERVKAYQKTKNPLDLIKLIDTNGVFKDASVMLNSLPKIMKILGNDTFPQDIVPNSNSETSTNTANTGNVGSNDIYNSLSRALKVNNAK